MADATNSGLLVNAARTIGSAIGQVVSAVGGGPGAKVWSAEYIGSGTFIIHKPKRKAKKRRQTALHSPRPGMRK